MIQGVFFSFLTFIALVQVHLLMFDCLILYLSQIETMCSLSMGELVVCFIFFLLICVKFLFSVWDTHFTFGG